MPETTILYVEDDERIRVGIVEMLEILGYNVSSAREESAAYRLYQAKRPDAVVTDVDLRIGGGGKEGGFDLCRRIRVFDNITPIIILSSDNHEERIGALEDPYVSFMQKPVRGETIAEEVDHLTEPSC